MNKGDQTLCDCGHLALCDGVGTGYGLDDSGHTVCYSCAGKADRKALLFDGKQLGYLSFEILPIRDARGAHKPLGYCYDQHGAYSNWPGTFTVPVHSVKRSINNFGAERLDFWFVIEGQHFYGVNVGDNQLARVRRVKG
jgi:hypothetical protein